MKNKNLLIKKNHQNEKTKGITLIALVVTIVVLLILAGITINLVFSENGIIKKAQEAGNKMNEAIESDKQAIQDLEDELIRASGRYPLKDIIEAAKTLKAKYDSEEGITTEEEYQGFNDLQNKINNSEYEGKLVNLEGTLVYVGDNAEEKAYLESQGINTDLTPIIRNVGKNDPSSMVYDEGFIILTFDFVLKRTELTETQLKKLIVNSDDETEQNKITFKYPSGETAFSSASTGVRIYYDGKFIGTLVKSGDVNSDNLIDADDAIEVGDCSTSGDSYKETLHLYALKAADFDNNGIINLQDGELIMQYVAEII